MVTVSRTNEPHSSSPDSVAQLLAPIDVATTVINPSGVYAEGLGFDDK